MSDDKQRNKVVLTAKSMLNSGHCGIIGCSGQAYLGLGLFASRIDCSRSSRNVSGKAAAGEFRAVL